MTKISKLHSQDIRTMRSAGSSTHQIHLHLKSVGVNATLSTIRRHYKERISRKRNPRKMNQDVVAAIENITSRNGGITASFVKKQLWRDNGVDISERSIRRIWQKLGWRYKKNLHCPLIQAKNKLTRRRQAQKWLDEKEIFDDAIFANETTVALDRFATNVHVWGAISRLGPGPITIFEGRMDRSFFKETIIRETAAPYIRENFGVHHRFFQANDSMHTAARKVIAAVGINWVKTPSESPDMNPIEMVWHALKDYVQKVAKPTTKSELIAAINKFWFEELTDVSINKYINRLFTVLPVVVRNQGGRTGMP